MNFKKICTLFGGQTAISKILGLNSARQVRRVYAGTNPVPKSWHGKLKKEAVKKADELIKFSEEE